MGHCYISNKTIKLLAELGDEQCLFFVQNECLNHIFGFVVKSGKVMFGPSYWTGYYTNKIQKNLKRLNNPTLCDTFNAFPIARKE